MTDEPHDPVLTALRDAWLPPLPDELRGRTLALARANLPPPGPRPWSLTLADYVPSPALVPSLLLSAAVVFTIEAVAKLTRFSGHS
jgi:hypothetical protein